MPHHAGIQRIHGYCSLCLARCGTVATVENGRFTRLDPDPSHPTGQAICAKGRAAPELVYHPDRLTHPLRRTRPKGDPDPGWERISWEEALDLDARRLTGIYAEGGLTVPRIARVEVKAGFVAIETVKGEHVCLAPEDIVAVRWQTASAEKRPAGLR